jgi:hypothetical protein
MTEPGEYMAELSGYDDTTCSLRVVVMPGTGGLDDEGCPMAPLAVVIDPLPITDESDEGARQAAQRLLGEHAFTASGTRERDGDDSCYWVHVVRNGNEASA